VDFQHRLLGDVFFVRWRKRDSAACARLLQILEQTRRQCGRALRYVSLIDEHVAPLPQEAAPIGAQLFFRGILSCCSVMRMVIEGADPRKALERLRSASIVVGVRESHRIAVYRSVSELMAADPTMRRELSAALASLSAAA
jgi:hypothetical protein